MAAEVIVVGIAETEHGVFDPRHIGAPSPDSVSQNELPLSVGRRHRW